MHRVASRWEDHLVGGEVDTEDHELDGNNGLQHYEDAVEQDRMPLIAQARKAIDSIRTAQRIEDDKWQACIACAASQPPSSKSPTFLSTSSHTVHVRCSQMVQPRMSGDQV